MKVKKYGFVYGLLWCAAFAGCFREQTPEVTAGFEHSAPAGHYTVPAEVAFANNSTGADFYAWTFEGGQPAASSHKQPEPVVYSTPGTYVVVLEAWNDYRKQRAEQIITIDSAVNVAFDAEILVNNYAPVDVQLVNYSQGGRSFSWTFEQGEPPVSDAPSPGIVRFSHPGDHQVILTVDNGSARFSDTAVIHVEPGLNVAFDIQPLLDNDIFEAPFTGRLLNQTEGALYHEWIADGGALLPDADGNAKVYYQDPGTYTVSLEAGNNKEDQTVSRQVVIAPNTNLYVFQDIRLGIVQAQNTVGCFYSCDARKVYTTQEVNATTGPLIDLVFVALNDNFSYCRFISPDVTGGDSPFYPIPGARKTYIVNKASPESPVYCTPEMFDAMVDDALLRGFPVAMNDSGEATFTKANVPQVVLFETADGRRGAIKVKAMVDEGEQSYAVVDLKVQKEKKR